jgi:hypothetical protein
MKTYQATEKYTSTWYIPDIKSSAWNPEYAATVDKQTDKTLYLNEFTFIFRLVSFFEQVRWPYAMIQKFLHQSIRLLLFQQTIHFFASTSSAHQ